MRESESTTQAAETPEVPKSQKVEIHYLIHDYVNKDQADFEKIIAAMGAFEDELNDREFWAAPTVEPRPYGESGVLIALIRNIYGRRMRAEALRDTEVMRVGLEQHFDEADRARLSARFSGIKVPADLETE